MITKRNVKREINLRNWLKEVRWYSSCINESLCQKTHTIEKQGWIGILDIL